MKKNKQPSSDQDDFFSFDDLPDEWECKKLGEIVSPSKEKIEPTADSTLPYIGLEHIESNTSKIIGRAIASEAKSTKTVFHSGDVLYGKLRPYLNKVAIPDFDGVCSTDILVFNKNQIIDSRYLMRYLTTGDVVEYANRKSKGISLPRVSFESLSEILIPLPPLNEQQRIVAHVEALLTHANAARNQLSRVPLIMKKFRQAVLAAACEGRLTDGWREENQDKLSTADVVDFIQSHSKKMSQISDKFGSFPETWIPVAIGDLFENWGGATPSTSEPSFWGGNIPWVSSKDIKTFRITQGSDFITQKALDGSRLKLSPIGSVLVVVRSGILAHTFPVAVNDAEVVINQDIKAFYTPNESLNEWLALFFRGQSQYILENLRKDGTTVQSIRFDDLKNMVLFVPSFSEQHEIVRRVTALFNRADQIEQQVMAATKRTEALTQTVLGKAFSGRLV